MFALGQKQTYAVHKGMSALLPKANMCTAVADVRFRLKADMCGATHRRKEGDQSRRRRSWWLAGRCRFHARWQIPFYRQLSRSGSLDLESQWHKNRPPETLQAAWPPGFDPHERALIRGDLRFQKDRRKAVFLFERRID